MVEEFKMTHNVTTLNVAGYNKEKNSFVQIKTGYWLAIVLIENWTVWLRFLRS